MDFLGDNKKEKISDFVKFVKEELDLEKCPVSSYKMEEVN